MSFKRILVDDKGINKYKSRMMYSCRYGIDDINIDKFKNDFNDCIKDAKNKNIQITCSDIDKLLKELTSGATKSVLGVSTTFRNIFTRMLVNSVDLNENHVHLILKCYQNNDNLEWLDKWFTKNCNVKLKKVTCSILAKLGYTKNLLQTDTLTQDTFETYFTNKDCLVGHFGVATFKEQPTLLTKSQSLKENLEHVENNYRGTLKEHSSDMEHVKIYLDATGIDTLIKKFNVKITDKCVENLFKNSYVTTSNTRYIIFIRLIASGYKLNFKTFVSLVFNELASQYHDSFNNCDLDIMDKICESITDITKNKIVTFILMNLLCLCHYGSVQCVAIRIKILEKLLDCINEKLTMHDITLHMFSNCQYNNYTKCIIDYLINKYNIVVNQDTLDLAIKLSNGTLYSICKERELQHFKYDHFKYAIMNCDSIILNDILDSKLTPKRDLLKYSIYFPQVGFYKVLEENTLDLMEDDKLSLTTANKTDYAPNCSQVKYENIVNFIKKGYDKELLKKTNIHMLTALYIFDEERFLNTISDLDFILRLKYYKVMKLFLLECFGEDLFVKNIKSTAIKPSTVTTDTVTIKTKKHIKVEDSKKTNIKVKKNIIKVKKNSK